MDPLDELYDRVATGDAPAPRAYDQYKRMLSRARRAARHGSLEQRQAAVAVTAAIGGHWALGVLRELSQDEDPDIRRRVLTAAIDQGEDGIAILRDLLLDAVLDIALLALRHLRMIVDRGSASRLRQLVRHESPEMRAQAVELLGHTTGPGLIVPLQRARANESDETVQAALDTAIDRLNGNLPKATPNPWWSSQPQEAWQPSDPVDLPDTLPTEPLALLQLLGDVTETGQQPIVEQIQQCTPAVLRDLVRTAQTGRDPAASIGLCILAHHLKQVAWVVPVRRLLIHNAPGVRVAAAQALETIGPPAVAMNLRDLLSDRQPAVRLAALRALRAVVPLDEALRYVYPLEGESDPSVLEELSSMRTASSNKSSTN